MCGCVRINHVWLCAHITRAIMFIQCNERGMLQLIQAAGHIPARLPVRIQCTCMCMCPCKPAFIRIHTTARPMPHHKTDACMCIQTHHRAPHAAPRLMHACVFRRTTARPMPRQDCRKSMAAYLSEKPSDDKRWVMWLPRLTLRWKDAEGQLAA